MGRTSAFCKALLNDHDHWMLIVPDQDIFEKNDFDFRDVHKKWSIPGWVNKCVDGTFKGNLN